MTNKKKKRARDLQAKGMSYQAAINVLDRQKLVSADAPPVLEAPADDFEALVKGFRAPHISSIRLERLRDHRNPGLGNRGLGADSGAVAMTITPAQWDRFLARGATEDGAVQMIRVFADHTRTTFSVTCASCHRWIWCGRPETAGTGVCVCGQRFDVSFDAPEDWSLPQGWRCMDCGAEFKVTEAENSRGPWKARSEHQITCRPCAAMSHIGPIARSRLRAMKTG